MREKFQSVCPVGSPLRTAPETAISGKAAISTTHPTRPRSHVPRPLCVLPHFSNDKLHVSFWLTTRIMRAEHNAGPVTRRWRSAYRSAISAISRKARRQPAIVWRCSGISRRSVLIRETSALAKEQSFGESTAPQCGNCSGNSLLKSLHSLTLTCVLLVWCCC